MTIKERIEKEHKLNLLWCSKCLRDLTPNDTWIPDDTHDGRIFCYECAPTDAIRLKDLT